MDNWLQLAAAVIRQAIQDVIGQNMESSCTIAIEEALDAKDFLVNRNCGIYGEILNMPQNGGKYLYDKFSNAEFMESAEKNKPVHLTPRVAFISKELKEKVSADVLSHPGKYTYRDLCGKYNIKYPTIIRIIKNCNGDILNKDRSFKNKKIICNETKVVYKSIREASQAIGVYYEGISDVLNTNIPCGGYTWRFL